MKSEKKKNVMCHKEAGGSVPPASFAKGGSVDSCEQLVKTGKRKMSDEKGMCHSFASGKKVKM